ncbi:MAG TPA: ferritin-like domain-containing protein [Verrucomicrobiae bacterium]|jgi:ferritin-like metal-binding protein YciE|nr:ferritin-like domain-containing protein [Verrucomicrobiae bacterium]
MKISALHDLYIEQLRELYDAEQQLRKPLAAAAKAAASQELKDALEEHLDQSEAHLVRLKEILESLGEDPAPKKCLGMAGLAAELQEMLEADAAPEVMDVGIIGSLQRIEHYEIAAYGCLSAYARLLGREEDSDILQETLDDEKEADEILTDIADTVNQEAHQGEGAEVDHDEEEEE